MTRYAARAVVAGLAATCLAVPAGSAHAAPEKTQVVLDVAGCEGCDLRAYSYQGDDVWSSKPVTVEDGRAVLTVPTARTEGMSIAVSAPWEEHLPAVGQVVFRYAGQAPGDHVTRAEARAARKGSACFPGIDAPQIELKVRVLRAHFPGVAGRATAPAAYTTVSQPTVGDRERVVDGFYGSQDVVPCD
jgi:hypothetical protein